MRQRLTRGVLAGTLTAAVLATSPLTAGARSGTDPAPQAAAAATTDGPVGTAATTSQLLRAALPTLTGVVPAEVSTLDLGGIETFASSDGDPAFNTLGQGSRYAVAALDLPLGQGVRVDSNGEGTAPAGQQALIGGLGTVAAGALTAEATDEVVRGSVAALDVDVALDLLGLGQGAPAGVDSVVTDSRAVARNGARLAGVSVSLTDLLGEELLGQLPLGVLLDLLASLGIPVPADVTAQLDQLEDVAGQIDDLGAQQEAVAAARQALADAQVAADTAQRTVDDLQAQLDAAEAELALLGATCEGAGALVPGAAELCETIQRLSSELVAAGLARDTANAAVDAAQAALDSAVAALANLTDQLLDAVEGLDLSDLIGSLVAALDGAPILEIGELSVGVVATATSSGSTGSALCTLEGVRVLDQDLAVTTCDDAEALVTDLTAGIQGVLDVLPVATGGLVSVTGPRVASSEADAMQGARYVADASVEALEVTVGELSLETVLDSVTGDLLASITGPLGDLGVPLPAEVGPVVDDVVAQLEALPTGELLDGVALEGLSLDLGDVTATSSFLGACVAANADPDAPVTIQRADGQGRIDTAIDVARCFDQVDTVMIARADVYADSLAGAPLAANEGAPLLLTPPDALVPEVAAEIERLGASKAVILGGISAIQPNVEESLRGLGLDTERFGGFNRFDTAARIADRLGATHDTVFIVQGGAGTPERGWPDAMTAAPYAAYTQHPILLVVDNSVPNETRDALARQRPTETIVVGGDTAVNSSTVAEIAAGGYGPRRLFGEDRFGTSAAVYEESLAQGQDVGALWLATGADWPDALITGPAAAILGASFMLVDGGRLEDSAATRDAIARHADEIHTVRLIGGPNTISPEVESGLRDLLDGPAE